MHSAHFQCESYAHAGPAAHMHYHLPTLLTTHLLQVELRPGGAATPVTFANRLEFCEMAMHARLQVYICIDRDWIDG